MKIIYDHQIFSTQRYGGISRYYYELAKGLAQLPVKNLQVKINSPLYVNNYLASDDSSSSHVMGAHVPDVPGATRICLGVNRVLSPILLKALRPDIVHGTYYSARSRKPRSFRSIITVYDMIHELFPESFSRNDRTSSIKREAVNRSDHVICISEHTRADLVQLFGVPFEKTSVVHLGFSLTSTTDVGIAPLDRPYLLYVGMRGGYKNFEKFLRAYASQSWVKNSYDILAFGGEGFTSGELLLMEQLGVSTKVHHRRGDDKALAQCYQGASLFVYPSLYEGFGIPPLEAMSYGCPVICSETSSLPEVVGNAAIMFDPSSIESMAACLLEVLQSSETCNELTKRGWERVQKFSWKRCAEETHAIYERVCS